MPLLTVPYSKGNDCSRQPRICQNSMTRYVCSLCFSCGCLSLVWSVWSISLYISTCCVWPYILHDCFPHSPASGWSCSLYNNMAVCQLQYLFSLSIQLLNLTYLLNSLSDHILRTGKWNGTIGPTTRAPYASLDGFQDMVLLHFPLASLHGGRERLSIGLSTLPWCLNDVVSCQMNSVIAGRHTRHADTIGSLRSHSGNYDIEQKRVCTRNIHLPNCPRANGHCVSLCWPHQRRFQPPPDHREFPRRP